MMKKSRTTEYRWAIWVAIGIMALTCVPYAIGYAIAPKGYHFLGFICNMDDVCVYLSWMRQAADGHFFLRNLFTTEPQSGIGFNLLFLALGTFSRITHLPLVAVLHLARIAAGIALLLAVYGMSAIWLDDERSRRIGLLIVGLSAGIGWVFRTGVTDILRASVDRWQLEAITYLSLYASPLYSFPTLLMIASLYFLLRFSKTGAWRYAVYAGLILLLLANVHTYDVITISAIWAFYSAYRLVKKDTRPMIGGLIAAAIAAPSAAYQFHFYKLDSVFRDRAAVPTPSPAIYWYAAGYGLLLPLAMYGVWRSVKQRRDIGFLICWIIATFVVAYLPISFQRKLFMGTHIPLSLLAAIGVMGLMERIPVKRQTLAVIILVGALIPSNLAFMSRNIVQVLTNEITTAAHVPYASKDEMAALEYLRTHSRPGDLILAVPPTACLIPGFAGRPVYCGHWGETVDFRRKFWEVFAFYSNKETPDQRLDFLREHNFAYVVGYHQHEGIRMVDFDAHPAPYLKPVFPTRELTVYKFETK